MLLACSSAQEIMVFTYSLGAGHEVTLKGWESYEAAVVCASIAAGQRMAESSRRGAANSFAVDRIAPETTTPGTVPEDSTAAGLEGGPFSGPAEVSGLLSDSASPMEIDADQPQRAIEEAASTAEPNSWLRSFRRPHVVPILLLGVHLLTRLRRAQVLE